MVKLRVGAVDVALRLVDGGDRQRQRARLRATSPSDASLAGSSWMRMAGFCSPPIETWPTPDELADLLREHGVGVVVDLGQRHRRRTTTDRIMIGESAGLTLR